MQSTEPGVRRRGSLNREDAIAAAAALPSGIFFSFMKTEAPKIERDQTERV